ncbi:MAG: DUF551 domain-containing protein [Kiritimatiellae bacterium]|nr:DUF551 domain-containing protein [Kiritimatiellia bacterium]
MEAILRNFEQGIKDGLQKAREANTVEPLVVFFPAQCKCGHLYLERYMLPQERADGWCGFCRTRRDVFKHNETADKNQKRKALFGVWISVRNELPPLDIPVWLYLPDVGQPVIGCRSDGGEGWLWCRCYDDFWFAASWKTNTAEAEDDHPSHWMALPLPPNAHLSGGEAVRSK